MFEYQNNTCVFQLMRMINMSYHTREGTIVGGKIVAKKCVFESSQLDNKAIY